MSASTLIRVLTATLALVVIGIAQVPAQEGRARPDYAVDLRGRYPRLFDHQQFLQWLKEHQVGPWHESGNADTRMLVVQDPPGNFVFAAQVSTGSGAIQQSQQFNLQQDKRARAQVADAAVKANLPQGAIHAIRPAVSFSGGKWDLEWRVEVRNSGTIETYVFSGGQLSHIAAPAKPKGPAPGGGSSAATGPDDLATNELHHPSAFLAEAQSWIAGATTTRDQAARIFKQMQSTYFYDATIVDIDNFTWADDLTRTGNNRRGVCDEWAVVTVTYLRSLGIKSRVKLLVWSMPGGSQAAHAAVEYLDGTTVRHMDALLDADDDRSVYRIKHHAHDVTVMDADHPLDSRTTTNPWHVTDPNGDGRLYPYGDFITAPLYPGDKRPGYSY
jgi:hypothetical protein